MTRESGSSRSAGAGLRRLTVGVAVVALSLSTTARAQLRTMVVDSGGDVGRYSSLAVDSHGAAHIGYYDATRQVLKYARIDASGVAIEVVDASAGVGTHCALAVDGTDSPHISYYDATNKNLKYAVRSGATWTVRTVDAPGDVGRFTSIALNQLNAPVIAYYDGGNGYLKLAWREAGYWEKRPLGPAELTEGTTGRSTAIQLDSMGSNPLVLFFDLASHTLKLGIFDRTSGQWREEAVRQASVLLQDLALRLDSANQPHVAFSELGPTGSETVQYARKTCLASGCITQVTPLQPTGEGTWTFEPVDAAAGTSASLALDGASNAPWVSFYDPLHGLRLARKTGAAWSVETVDPGWEVGTFGALALDDGDGPRLAYHDQANGDLRYAAAALPRPIDVWIRDCAADDGSEPSTPRCPIWHRSPDVWFRPPGSLGPAAPVPGVPNDLVATVRNRGSGSAEHVTVRFSFAKLTLPPPPGLGVQLTPIGERVVSVAAGQARRVSVRWSPPGWIRTTPLCILVVLDHPADRPGPPPPAPRNDDNAAVRCYPPGG